MINTRLNSLAQVSFFVLRPDLLSRATGGAVIYWQAPSGSQYLLEDHTLTYYYMWETAPNGVITFSEFPELHRRLMLSVFASRRWWRRAARRVRHWGLAYAYNTSESEAAITCCDAPRLSGHREVMSRQFRADLGELVRRYISSTGGESCDVVRSVVSLLNSLIYQSPGSRWGIARSLEKVVNGLRDAHNASVNGLGSRIVLGECGHFCFIDDAHPVADRHGDTGGYACNDCVLTGHYVRPEDGVTGSVYEVENLHAYEGMYYVDEENSPGYYNEDYEEESDYDDGYTSYESDSEGIYDYSVNVLKVLDRLYRDYNPRIAPTIGIELEMYMRRGERSASVREILSQSVQLKMAGHAVDLRVRDLLIFKHDGSLDADRGAELVTIPLLHTEAIALFKQLVWPDGSIAWNARSCGMHVHIDSRAFTVLAFPKFVAFWNDSKNASLINLVAGRHPNSDSQAASYAGRANTNDSDNVLRKAKQQGESSDRYRIINLTNLSREERNRLILSDDMDPKRGFSTAEIRVFRASLRKARLLAQIDMAAASVQFAHDASLNGTGETEFRAWLRHNVAQYPHLAEFLGIKRPSKPRLPVVEVEDEANE